jgi:hypothetical protein
MNTQTTRPSTARAQVRQLLGLCAWITLDVLVSWVWSLAGSRAAGLFCHESA